MKTTKHNLPNDEVVRIKQKKHLGIPERSARPSGGNSHQKPLESRTLSFFFVICLGSGLFTFVPLTLAHGSGGGHPSGMSPHGKGNPDGHRRYLDPFWSSPFLYHTGIYDSAYCYTPTPQQQTTARQQVETYLLGVQKSRRPAATHRYISVETLRPTKKQFDDFTKKQQTAQRAKPAQLRCLMVFDTQTREFVGSGCYIVGSEPVPGEVARFESVSAEFVGHGL
jgi:hypothetical protein